MKKTIFLFFFLSTIIAGAQEKFTLSGTVSETATGETLIGVNVIIPELQSGTITNEYGFYSITLPKGNYEVYYSSIGFRTKKESVTLTENIKLNFSLEEASEELDEVNRK